VDPIVDPRVTRRPLHQLDDLGEVGIDQQHGGRGGTTIRRPVSVHDRTADIAADDPQLASRPDLARNLG